MAAPIARNLEAVKAAHKGVKEGVMEMAKLIEEDWTRDQGTIDIYVRELVMPFKVVKVLIEIAQGLLVEDAYAYGPAHIAIARQLTIDRQREVFMNPVHLYSAADDSYRQVFLRDLPKPELHTVVDVTSGKIRTRVAQENYLQRKKQELIDKENKAAAKKDAEGKQTQATKEQLLKQLMAFQPTAAELFAWAPYDVLLEATKLALDKGMELANARV